MSGKTYAHAVVTTVYSGSSNQITRTTEWNLGRYFSTLNGTIGITDTSKEADATFTVEVRPPYSSFYKKLMDNSPKGENLSCNWSILRSILPNNKAITSVISP